jgi:hypothetical protein
MFAIWSPQPNWIPRKPKLMFQMVENFVRCSDMSPRCLTVVEIHQLAEASVMMAGVTCAQREAEAPVPRLPPGKVHPRLVRPSPSTSCIGIRTVLATEASAARISTQCISVPSVLR